MKQEERISVIIPVYNVEKYVGRCIESVLGQTYRNLEIWLVDDGATDSSGKICDEYARKDERIRVIHKENGGLSDARNTAIEKMTGKYVTFIDSDDFVADCFIERLYRHARKYQAEVVISGFLPTKKTTAEYTLEKKIEIYTAEEALKELLYQKKYNTSAWGKLYLSSLFEQVRYPKGKLYEDICTTYQLIEQSTKIAFDSSKLYFYYQDSVSIVRSEFNIRKMDYVYNTKILYDFIYENYPSLRKAADFRYLWANLHIWVNIPDQKKYQKYCKTLERNIKRYRFAVCLDKEVALKAKISILLSYGGWKIARTAYVCSKK
jgi:glycosyltransferase involved in cell wall biosynthesis